MSTKTNKLLIGLALVSFASASLAMGPPGGCKSRGFGPDGGGYIMNELNLTSEQQSQVKTILQEQRETAKAWKQKHAEETQAKLGKVLTPEQLEEYKAFKQHHRFHGKKGGFKRPFYKSQSYEKL